MVILVAVLSAVMGGGATAGEASVQGLAGLPLPAALRVLQDDGLNIIFSSSLVRDDMQVLEEPTGRWPREILVEILAPHGLQAQPGPGDALLVVKAPPRGILRGRVRLAGGRAPLPGVRISVPEIGAECTSDASGRFALPALVEGVYSVRAELMGYRTVTVENVQVSAGGETGIELEMTPATVSHEKMVVHAGEPAASRHRPEEHQYLGRAEIGRMPGHSADPFRSMDRVPAVAVGEASGDLHVRGGARDEIMIVLDGLEIYDPFHLKDRGGLIGIVDSRVVDGIGVLGGAYPAEYGGRMGGVIEMSSLAAPDEMTNGAAISTEDARFVSRGAFSGAAGQWLLSGRWGDPSRLVDALGADPSYRPRYHDFFGKVGYRLGASTGLSLSLLASEDDFEGDDSSLVETIEEPGAFRSRHGNDYLWLTLESRWSSRVFSRTILSGGRLATQREGSNPVVQQVVDDRVASIIGLKQDWLFRSDRHVLKWGADLKHLRGEYAYRSIFSRPPGPGEPDPDPETGKVAAVNPAGGDLGLYLADRVRLLPAIHAEIGLRWDLQTYAAEPERTLSPRINLVYALGSRSTLRAGWGYFYQPERIFELQIQDGIDTFSAAQRSKHHVLGFQHQFDGGFGLQASAYLKTTENPRVRFENLFDPFGFFPEADGDRVRIAPDEAQAQGLELLFTSPEGGRLSWWGGYTLASVEDHVDGAWVPRSWDRRHTLNLGLSLRPWAGWELTLVSLSHTGRPTTPVTSTSRPLPDGSLEMVPVLGPRNSDRLPAYHRLDLRISRSMGIKGTDLKAFVNVTNLLDRENVCCVESFDFIPAEDGSVEVVRNDRHGLSRLLTFGVSWTF
jgi:hypothetical protein